MQKGIMYSTDTCPFCVQAKRLLAEKGVEVMEIKVDAEPGKLKEIMGVTGRRRVPQIFIGGTHVGGYDDLSALARAGQLDAMLTSGQDAALQNM